MTNPKPFHETQRQFQHGQKMSPDMALKHGLVAEEWTYCAGHGDFLRFVDVTDTPENAEV